MDKTLTLAQGQAVLSAALAHAESSGLSLNVAVVDTAAHLLTFARQDGAILGSIDISCRKARTAALMKRPTAEFAVTAAPGGPVYGVEVTNGGLALFGGGVLLTFPDGTVVGAVGVSGGSVEEDCAAADAGAAVLSGPA